MKEETITRVVLNKTLEENDISNHILKIALLIILSTLR